MARIAEDLLLLLLDNASAQPGLDRSRRARVLSAAVLLDLAYGCLIRPAVDGDPVPAGQLVALSIHGSPDPVGAPALQLLQRRPLPPRAAVRKLRRHTEDSLLGHLERTRQIGRAGPPGGRVQAWPLINRDRAADARTQLLAALFDRRPPAPSTAAIITLLHAADGLGALLSLNDRGWRWVHGRAGEIALGSWVDESPADQAAMTARINLAVTASAMRPALS
ncbi:GPP34 family phosphoprotein [Mycolicibacterium sp. S2-37]|uniref:GOLPH3/VPS74 family protein n=1 Tax=Mycolicibacterium sp. S2-37 TaxID=2810297 RepID=UPI001A94FB47|nr:GPP34 family phosphoprotein [Mycolicibacterium sp. S2-37]MBO0679462.1 GPP34 family phosphoprotein [Mycolicibacterium sp. S2-37]